MGDGWIFLKTHHNVSFNEVLWNEPTFGPDPSRWTVPLKVHKREKYFGSDFEFFTIL
jgi:hypothetical protein